MSERQESVISARIPVQLKRLVGEFLRMDTHLNESDLVRDALREKIRKDAPQLYAQLFQEAMTA